MTPSKTRLALSWIIGIIIFLGFYYIFEERHSIFGFSLNFLHEYYYGERQYSALGIFSFFMALVISIRTGMAIYYGNFKDGMLENGNLILLLSTTGLFAITLTETLITPYFKQYISQFFYKILDLLIVFGVILICRSLYLRLKK